MQKFNNNALKLKNIMVFKKFWSKAISMCIIINKAQENQFNWVFDECQTI